MPRNVVIAACALLGDVTPESPPDVLRRRALDALEQAGEQGADIVVVPEGAFSDCDTTRGPQWLNSPCERLEAAQALAARYRMYILAPVVLESHVKGEKGTNTVVVIGRDGHEVGRYDKTHLCWPSIWEGESIKAGASLPVFELDFGTIGIATCQDIHYPELFRVLALKGAELIFWPTGMNDRTGDMLETLVKARALDNQAYVVCSHYSTTPYLSGRDPGRSRVVDPMGRIRVSTGHFPGIAVTTIDLDETYPMWHTGEALKRYPTMRRALFQTRRPELYAEIVRELSGDAGEGGGG